MGENIFKSYAMVWEQETKTECIGRLYYQTSHYRESQLRTFANSDSVLFLFGDNDQDKNRRASTPRDYCSGQAEVTGLNYTE